MILGFTMTYGQQQPKVSFDRQLFEAINGPFECNEVNQYVNTTAFPQHRSHATNEPCLSFKRATLAIVETEL